MLHTPNLTTIVTAVKDRFDPLKYTLPTWLEDDAVKQVLMVDWGSSKPLRDVIDEITHDRKVRVIRVENAKYWILSWAYNFIIPHVATRRFLKLDADVILTRLNIGGFVWNEGEFIAGDWRNRRNHNENYLNGQFAAMTSDFHAVGGYDERIQRYGWEDDDLYNRFESNGLKKLKLKNDLVFHLPHSDKDRTANTLDPKSKPLECSKKMERMTEDSSPWNSTMPKIQYERVEGDLYRIKDA